MKDFLTDQEIEELTGAKQESKQKEILTKNRIFFVERMDGKIKVCWHHVHHAQRDWHIPHPLQNDFLHAFFAPFLTRL